MMVKNVLWNHIKQNSDPGPDTQYVALGRLYSIFQFIHKMNVIQSIGET